ncbi:hypothetical protein PSI19_13725 [Xenorhabdus khoisanae]|uniref:hypothetical protein n=1 Tax=Xenorhabdus khoisanae TaxID=880157 RepID=UPI0023585EE8|nr:hypothetical protein [Xenorhabdus khoisanae]MDC9614901.1 hypothetical protein [Xenorhabdus khoisanae]
MFKHDLGQSVQVTISGEKGHIKARAEYTHGVNQYLIHYLAADGWAVDAWFEEGELSSTENKCINPEALQS